MKNAENLPYLIDIWWFDKIRCRQPMYNCINYYEYYILNKENEIIDVIKLYPKKMGDRYVETDEETYKKIKAYMNEKRKAGVDMKEIDKILGIIIILIALAMIVFTFIFWFGEETAIIQLASFYLALSISVVVFVIGFSLLKGKSEEDDN